MGKIAKPLAVIAGFIAASLAYRFVADWVRREPRLDRAALAAPWKSYDLSDSRISLLLPFALEQQQATIPDEVKKATELMTVYGGEKEGLSVNVSYIRLSPTVEGSLAGAADGAIQKMRAVPGTKSVEAARTGKQVAGLPGLELDGRIEREKGPTLKLHSVLVHRGPEMWQVLAVHVDDADGGAEVWKRIEDGVSIAPAP